MHGGSQGQGGSQEGAGEENEARVSTDESTYTEIQRLISRINDGRKKRVVRSEEDDSKEVFSREVEKYFSNLQSCV